MATVVQQLDYIINILEDTRPAGEQVLYTISTTAIAKPIHREPNPDTVQFLSDDGEPTASVILDGTLKVHDLGGSPVVWVGTIDDFVLKMNNEYLNNSVTSVGGGGGGGDASAANQATQITEAQTANTTLSSIDTALATIDAVLDSIKLDTDNLNLGTLGTHSVVPSSATVVTLKAANTARKSIKITNNGNKELYIKEGSGSSLSSYTWVLFEKETVIIDDYNGIITGIWNIANGDAQITETT